MRERHIFGYLSQVEWKACFALVFATHIAFEYRDAYPLRRYASGDSDDSLAELFTQAVRYLALEHGTLFAGLTVDAATGTPLAHSEDYLEPRNMIYLSAFATGTMPSPIEAIRVAIPWLQRHAPEMDLDPLHDLLSNLERMRQEAISGTPRKLAESYAKARRKAVASLIEPAGDVN